VIAKEKTSKTPTDKFGKAGFAAERQMAFYLRREFAETPDVFVFNDLRIRRNGETAQIDHLVLHPFGFLLIESKSVTGTIHVNEQHEFVREFSGKTTGMKSPVTQVRMQSALLKKVLDDEKESLRRKVLFGLLQAGFHASRFEHLVAISDQGVIKRKGEPPIELLKADAVASRIAEFIERRRKALGMKGILRYALSDRKTQKQIDQEEMQPFTDQELSSIRDFVLSRCDEGRGTLAEEEAESLVVASLPDATPVPHDHKDEAKESSLAAASAYSCRHCSSQTVEIVYGKYGYYFKCGVCDGNTKIDFTCSRCEKKAKIRKSGMQFFWNCAECGNDASFHTNL
jgi:hypothetical protein